MAKANLTTGAQAPFGNLASMFQRGSGGILPERGSAAQRDLVQSLVGGGMRSAQSSGSPLLAFLAPMVGGAASTRAEGLFGEAQEGRDQDAIDQILGAMGGGAPADVRVSTSETASNGWAGRRAPPAASGQPFMPPGADLSYGDDISAALTGDPVRDGIIETAAALQMDPMDLATVISYETAGTFDPTKAGPTTQWGQHRGLIQFGEPQAREYGVDWNDPIGSQLGADGAVANYFRGNGFRPGMGLLDAYSIVNAGGPGRYNASDANNGGAPGTVRDKVETQMADHRRNAERLLGGDFTTYANVGRTPQMGQDDMRMLMGLMTQSDVSEPIRDIASTMLTGAMGNRGGMSPTDQIDLAQSMLGLENAMSGGEDFRPATAQEAAAYGAQAGQFGPDGRFYPSSGSETGQFRAATPEEAAAYGATAGQIGPDGRFYPSDPPDNSSGNAGVARQRNEATTIISGAVEDLENQGYSREEALAMVARDPIYAPQFQLLDVDPTQIVRGQEQRRTAEQAQPGFWAKLFGAEDSPASPSAAPTPAQPVPPQIDNDPLGLR